MSQNKLKNFFLEYINTEKKPTLYGIGLKKKITRNTKEEENTTDGEERSMKKAN